MAKKNTPKAENKTPEDTVPDKVTEAESGPAKYPSSSPETPSDAPPDEAQEKLDDTDATAIREETPDAPETDPQEVPQPAEDTQSDKTDSPPVEGQPPEASEDLADKAGPGDMETEGVEQDKAHDSDTPDTDTPTQDTTEVFDTSDPEPSAQEQNTSSHEPASAPAKVEQVVVRKGGFVPVLLGGIAAGGAGFAAAYFGLLQQPDPNASVGPRLDELSSEISRQAQTLEDLNALLDAVPAAPDLAPLNSQIDEIAAQADDMGASVSANAAELSAMSDRLDEIDARLSGLEQAPVTAEASEAAVRAYESELDAARAQIAEQRKEMEAQRDELAAMIDEAKSSENDAEEAAMQSMRRAAIGRIAAAVENGSAFADALSELEATGIEPPDALAAVAQDGAPSATALQASFPDTARAALSASRQAAVDSGEVSGFSDFLRSQLGARSLEPQEGNDPDAVLSRAEAAVREGRLAKAIDELDALPEAGKAVVTDWIAQANRRLDAINAAQTLSEKLN